MAEKSIIAWTDNTFNPAMGCVKVSDGCKNCYAERLTRDRMGLSLWGPNARRQITTDANWKKPLAWNREADETGKRLMVFCASLCDVFEDHPTINGMRPRLWSLIRSTPMLDWQLLTKRPERIIDNLPANWGEGWPNVWLGTSIENMKVAARADHLRNILAPVRFISYEPALGSLDNLDITGIDWVIYGGESGPGFHPHSLDWPREMHAKCQRSGAAFFYKQSPAYKTELGTTLDGKTIRKFPTPRTGLSGDKAKGSQA